MVARRIPVFSLFFTCYLTMFPVSGLYSVDDWMYEYMEKLAESELAGETKVLGETLIQ
jgi:hypothetical protein